MNIVVNFFREIRVRLEALSSKIKQSRVQQSLMGAGALVHSLIILWPILKSPFSGDDTFDSMIPMQVHYSGQTNWSYIYNYVSNWSTNEGRFFPVASITGFFSHYLFTARDSYKIVQLLVVLVALSLFVVFVARLFKNFYTGILAVIILNTCLQMRVQYDPLFQFSLQQPFLITILSGSFSLFVSGIRKINGWKLIAASLLYLFAMLTYESALLLWPVFVLLLIIEKPKSYWRALLISAAPAVLVAVNLLRLRSKVSVTSAGYTSNFEIMRLAKTFVKQAVGSVPISYSELQKPAFLESFPAHLNTSSFWWLVAIGISIVLVLALLPKVSSSGHKVNLGAALIGLLLWVVPALVVAQTVRWQNELVLGNAYITWLQGSLGFTLIVVALLLECKTLILKCPRSISIFSVFTFALMVAIGSSSVVTNNPRAVAQFNPGYLWPRETFESAIKAGVFNEVSPRQPVLALGAEWWLNAPFVYWWGGPKIQRMDSQRSVAEWSLCVSDPITCLGRGGYSYVVSTNGYDLSGSRTVMVGHAKAMAGVNGLISRAVLSAPRIFIDYPSKSSSIEDSKLRCLGWGKMQILKTYQSVEAEDLKIIEARKESCLLKFGSRILVDAYQFSPN